MDAKLELIRELEKRGLRDMARKAQAGEYSNMNSPTSSRLPPLCKSLRRPAIPTSPLAPKTATSTTRGDASNVIRIAITQAAFDAIAATLPLDSVSYEPALDEGDLRYIWLEPRWLDRLKSYRGPGESYSDVILRLAAEG
jgi:hypothetical protein